jgi:outer membrane protein assembly factor BamB
VKRLLIAVAVLVLLAAGGVGAYVLYVEREGRDVRGSPTVEFVPTAETEPQTLPREPDIPWPTYGFNQQRLRAADFQHRPPFRRLWWFGARTLVEFPPAIGYGRLYFTNNTGVLYAVGAANGRRGWRFKSGRCVAASPAVAHRLVYQAFLNPLPCNRNDPSLEGEVIAFAPGSGRIRWRTKIGPSESSPLVSGKYLYVGDWRGNVYALQARTGAVLWRAKTDGRVKAALALSGGRVYVGAYDGRLYAFDARTGRRIWRSSSQTRLAGLGNFYSTPAVAYGRVYLGSTDGKVYSFGATSGKLRWSQDTGGYVYASPAVWRRRILVGSYSGRFYALDAATGDVRWRFDANGPISGSPTVLDGVVYFATLKERTYALDARNGRQLWTFPDGKYSPAVADDERLYLVGYARVYGLTAR